MDFIKEFVDVDNEIPLQLTTQLELPEGGSVRADGFTLGMVARELQTHGEKYFVRVNARSGAIPSNTFQQAQLIRVMQNVQPGTPAHFKLMEKFSKLNDQDLTAADLGQQPAPEAGPEGAPPVPGPGGAPVGEEITAAASGTDRVVINPRSAEQVPAI
jgi:hypothetical protein